MYVCICHAVTDRDIDGIAAQGCGTLRQLREELGVGTSCGRCVKCAKDTLESSLALRAKCSHDSTHLATI